MMSEIRRAANTVVDEHRMVANCARYIQEGLGEGTGQFDGVASYFDALRADIGRMIDRIEVSSWSHALEMPYRWRALAANHANVATKVASQLTDVSDGHAQALIGITAETVTATQQWGTEVIQRPDTFIPPTIVEGLRMAMAGLEEAARTAKAKGAAIKDEADSLAYRASRANENLTI
jgi:hypothetical protein